MDNDTANAGTDVEIVLRGELEFSTSPFYPFVRVRITDEVVARAYEDDNDGLTIVFKGEAEIDDSVEEPYIYLNDWPCIKRSEPRVGDIYKSTKNNTNFLVTPLTEVDFLESPNGLKLNGSDGYFYGSIEDAEKFHGKLRRVRT